MGGAVMLASFNDGHPPPKADGYILVAPAIWARKIMPVWQRVILEFMAYLIPLFEVTGQGLNRMTTDNREELLRRWRDPLVIKSTRIDTIYGLVNLMDAALEGVSKLPKNSLVLLGQKDDIIPKEATSTFLELLKTNNCIQVAKYRSGYHMLLRDLKSDKVLADLSTWIMNPNLKLLLNKGNIGVKTQGAGESSSVALNCARPNSVRP